MAAASRPRIMGKIQREPKWLLRPDRLNGVRIRPQGFAQPPQTESIRDRPVCAGEREPHRVVFVPSNRGGREGEDRGPQILPLSVSGWRRHSQDGRLVPAPKHKSRVARPAFQSDSDSFNFGPRDHVRLPVVADANCRLRHDQTDPNRARHQREAGQQSNGCRHVAPRRGKTNRCEHGDRRRHTQERQTQSDPDAPGAVCQ
jgi:hypothetical protein